MKLKHFLNQQGIGIVEALGAISISSILILGLLQVQILAYKSSKKTFNEFVATRLAYEKLEDLKLQNPSTLDSSDNQVETGLTRESATFIRTTNISINADRSRTIVISVQNDYQTLGTNVSVEETIGHWGET